MRYALCGVFCCLKAGGRSSNLKAFSADPRALQRRSGSEIDRQGGELRCTNLRKIHQLPLIFDQFLAIQFLCIVLITL